MMSPLREFYKDKTILITGGTGYMGKVLIEKLLRTLPDIKRIYILLRPKKGLDPHERIEAMTKAMPLTANNIDPKLFDKLVGIQCDLTEEDMGLSEEGRNILTDEVNIVFHMAASVRMDLKLKTAMILNTLSTQRVLELCTEMKELMSVVHLSTAYCNIDINYMEEKVYQVPISPYKVIDVAQSIDEDDLEYIKDKFMKPHPNTYTYSKRLAELVAWDMGKKLPLSIARPSIVIPSLYEPTPGWVDNLNGPIGLLTAAGKGVVRTILADENTVPQVIPVDIAINALIIMAWNRTTQKFFETPVYNLTQGDVIKLTWKESTDTFKNFSYKYPFKKLLWYPNATATTNVYLHKLMVLFYHMIPAYFVDFLMYIFMAKPFLVDVQRRINHGFKVLAYFALRKFTFTNENALQLNSNLTAEEKIIFYIVSDDIDVDDYLKKLYFGVKKFCFNENLDNMHIYRFQLLCYYLLDKFTKLIILYGCLWIGLQLLGVSRILSISYWFH